MLGSPRACRISRARFLTSSRRAISVRPAASIEIGNAAAWISRVPPGSLTRTVDPLVGRPTARRQARRKLVGIGPALEAQQVGAEQSLDHLPAPRQLGEDLIAGERYVVEKADPDVAAQLAQHPRYQLELVVVHPDGRTRRRLLRRRLREPPVDR